MVADAPVLANSGLAYASDVGDNVAEADIAVQLTGTTQIAVYRGVVETWKCLHDLALESAPGLELAGFYSGHQRDDRRSWIDFHDGINNLPKRERERAIAIKPSPDAGWTAGGTYLAYLRVVVDLAAWRRLSRTEQEHLVGRDKLTGAPLLQGGEPASGCPVAGTTDVLQKGNEEFRAQRFPDPLGHSHIQRANANRRQYPQFSTSARIFRQGFEFLETLDRPPYFRAGLNFVSFQDSPERLHSILTRDGWLGGTNFGGDLATTPAGSWLLTVRAAGMFLVPPIVGGEAFPGSSIFG
jgi:deferrochelatase/peroxidase EfeB